MEKYGYVYVTGNKMQKVMIVKEDHDFVIVQIPGTDSRWRIRRTKVFSSEKEAPKKEHRVEKKSHAAVMPISPQVTVSPLASVKAAVKGWGTFRSPH